MNFVAPIALDRVRSSLAERYGLNKRFVAVDNCRALTKADLPLNDAMPSVTVDADTFAVRIDGELIEARPAEVLPMAQRYLLF